MDSDEAKLFVGGISRVTSDDTLKRHFEKYGTVLGSSIAKDRVTKNSRGFGFVWFSDPAAADQALQDSHVIQGKTVSSSAFFFHFFFFTLTLSLLNLEVEQLVSTLCLVAEKIGQLWKGFG